jgi:intracellular multiplication protein IcmG
MADEFKDDEYHFSESGEPEAFDEEEIKSSVITTTGTTQLKRVIIGLVGIFIIVLLGFKMIAGKGDDKRTAAKKESAKPTVTAKAEPKASKPVKVVRTQVTPESTPVLAAAPVNNFSGGQATYRPVVSEPSAKVMRQLRTLNRAREQTSDQIGQLNNKLGEVNSSVSETADKLDKLNNSIQRLTEKLIEQQTEINALKKEKKIAQLKKKKAMEKPEAVYYVQALIPGRAWLQSTRGDIKTVAKGVELPGYGKVIEIYAKKGEITTTSGKVITFSPADI